MLTGILAVSLPTVILFPMSSKHYQQAVSAHHLPHCEQGVDAFVACIVHTLRLSPEAKLTTCCVGTEWPAFDQVAGNVHFAPGKSFQQGNVHVHDLVPFPDKNFDLSHTITKLTFGTGYPGQQNPLDGVFINQTTSSASQAATGMWQYFLKVFHWEHLQYASRCALDLDDVDEVGAEQFVTALQAV
jgi:hypothetical protein